MQKANEVRKAGSRRSGIDDSGSDEVVLGASNRRDSPIRSRNAS